MNRFARMLGWVGLGCIIQGCSVVPAEADPRLPDRRVRQIVSEREAAVLVTDKENLRPWRGRGLFESRMGDDADGGSATPVTADGYFLTANHVLAELDSRKVFVICGENLHGVPVRARVVWRDESGDLALLHIPRATPRFYHWSDPRRWLVEGSPVIHGGVITGAGSDPGKMGTSLAPETLFTGIRKFKINIPLQPGDSGGPVVDAYGALVGINSAVEFLVPMETAFFVDSEASRPQIRQLEAIIERDRVARRQLLTRSGP